MSSCRVPRKDFIVPRCTTACPAGIDVPRYIRAVKAGHFDDALAVVREKIPLPVVCADACFAPCEDACAYRQYGDPIAIRALKRVAVDKGGDSWLSRKTKSAPTGKQIAVVGAGPAGLTAAYYLATLGHQVTILDAFPEPGGTLRYGIPKYRLPEERINSDINHILDLGVTFKGNVQVGGDVSLDQVRKEHDAVFIASGANSSIRIPLDGSDKQGVLWGLEFLRDVALGKKVAVGSSVVVVGGGNAAIDVALTAKRLGAKNIAITSRKAKEDMFAHPREIAVAEEEGITIHSNWAPKRILGDSKVTGLGLIRCTSVYDEATCNYNPIPDEQITHRIDADTVILAVGQTPVLDFISEKGLKTSRNLIAANDEDLSTAEPGVFAGGDVVRGPASIILGIAHGRRAAQAIDKYLGGGGDISEQLADPEDSVEISAIVPRIDSPEPRNDLPQLATWKRTLGFDQIELPLSEQQLMAEASRCLNCDARKFQVTINTDRCKECGYCNEVCGMQTFGPAARFNPKGYRPMEVKSSDHCVGCLRCFFSCPDFAIDVKEATS
ncbi:MAG: FAD-dependent oxidoreductase [Syntrophobacteraceae bacterium]